MEAEPCVVLKQSEEDRFLLLVAYACDKADTSVAKDGHRDVAKAATVERAAWRFMLKGAKLGLWHEEGHDDCARTVESYIWRGDPWVMKAADGSVQTIVAGDWLIGCILTPRTWAMYKAGMIGGASPQGRGIRGVPDAEYLAQLRS